MRRASVPAGEADDGEGDGSEHDCAAHRHERPRPPARREGCCRRRRALRRGWKLLAQDRLLELLERRARIDAELLDERAARVPVDVQRLCLAARTVEREHQLGTEALAERVGGDELLQLSHDVRVPAEGKIGLDPALERGQAQLLEPRDRRLRERLVGEVGKRWPAPEREGLTQRLGCLGGFPGPSARSPASTSCWNASRSSFPGSTRSR